MATGAVRLVRFADVDVVSEFEYSGGIWLRPSLRSGRNNCKRANVK